jgi:hypothetical protein
MSMLRRSFLFCAIVLVSAPTAVAAGDLSADEIAKRIVNNDGFTWDGAESRIRMILQDKSGEKRERVLDVIGRRTGGRYQTVVRFRAPGDVAGTAFLMREAEAGKSEQHIYLPGLRRTRRIAGREREGSFMGSDFTYADLRRADDKHATHKRLPDESVGGTDTYVIESTISKEAKSQYSKIVTWVRKTDFVPLRTRFHGPGGDLLKTLYARKVKELDGRPVVVEARMQSEDGHATVLFIDSMERKENLPDSAFTPEALAR